MTQKERWESVEREAREKDFKKMEKDREKDK